MSVLRYKLQVTDLLYSKSLDQYPEAEESQAAKMIFAKWLKEHPKYSADDVDMCIKSYGREEDYMGHFGHTSKYVRIFKRREETDSEYNARIAKEESEILDKFRNKLHYNIKDLIREFSIYPNMDSDEIDAHVNNIEDAIIDVVVKDLRSKSNLKE